jgi:SAM-dependent methyltransferase
MARVVIDAPLPGFVSADPELHDGQANPYPQRDRPDAPPRPDGGLRHRGRRYWTSAVEHGCCARLGSYPFSSYVGLDPTPEAIAQARTRADERTRFGVGDPIEIELGKFDVVICSEVLYFATDPPALIDRVGIFLVRRGHVLSSIWRHPVRSALA